MLLENTQKSMQQHRNLLTKDLKQAIDILQMPVCDLISKITAELEENPLLETLPGDSGDGFETAESASEDCPAELYAAAYDASGWKRARNFDGERVLPIDFASERKTLKDFLREQLCGLRERPEVLAVCEYIIECVGGSGYLEDSVTQISETLKIPLSLAEYALKLVQTFQPAGVGARSLKECLALQLEKQKKLDGNLSILIDRYLNLIASNSIREISKKLGIKQGKAIEYCNLIRSLEPRPSRGFDGGEANGYIVPEAFILARSGQIEIRLNADVLPRLTVSRLYQCDAGGEIDAETKKYIREKKESAGKLIRAVKYRNTTIYRIIVSIAKRQKEYFLMGESRLKPMRIYDIAKELNLHESTVSRALSQKYVLTPFGTVELRRMFSNGLSDSGQNNVSSVSVKQKISEIISREDKLHPVSDADIVNALSESRISISRRTVAKYRDEMQIDSSSRRRIYS